MSFSLIEMSLSSRPTILTAAIRREILSVLAGSETLTVPAATAQIAAGWSKRRQRRGDSPSSVRTAAAIVFQVGAELVHEEAARRSAGSAGSGAVPLPREPLGGCGALTRHTRKGA